MRISTEASLQKLRTSYIDILYLHLWNFDTSVEEVVNRIAQPSLGGQSSSSLFGNAHSFMSISSAYDAHLIRAFPMGPPGLRPRRINTLVTTGKRPSLFIKRCGTWWGVLLSATSFQWPTWKVSHIWVWEVLVIYTIRFGQVWHSLPGMFLPAASSVQTKRSKGVAKQKGADGRRLDRTENREGVTGAREGITCAREGITGAREGITGAREGNQWSRRQSHYSG